MTRFNIVFLLFFLLLTINYSQTIVVNETMSSNKKTIQDEDGDFPDWIELYNYSDTSINLKNYGLSDDLDDPYKWTLPEVLLSSKEYLLIFASGKNKYSDVNWYETIYDWGDYWRYKSGNSAPPSDWNKITFNDVVWSLGKSGFGFGDGDDSTIISNTASVFVRNSFTIEDTSNVLQMILDIDYDDAFVAYLNGFEIARANIGTIGNPPAYNTYAVTPREALLYQGGKTETYTIHNFKKYLKPGKNVFAIQVHNSDANSSDLSLIPILTLGLKVKPGNANGISKHITLPRTAIHTNFKLNADGDTIVITSPGGVMEDLVKLKDFPVDVSFGRKPDGQSKWLLFEKPTPGSSNITNGYELDTKAPSFSYKAGFYPSTMTLSLSPFVQGDSVYYTLDGSTPTKNSALYRTSIIISKTTVVKARTFKYGAIPSPTETRTYIIGKKTLPVMSISTAPGNFFNADSGIYELGKNYESQLPYYGANFWQDWERPVHLEFFETDGINGFYTDAGAQIFGAWSRAKPQKSLALYARGIYGEKKFNYPLFPNLPFTQYDNFILRNGGNDWEYTMFRDELMHSLIENTGVDVLAYRPCIVYINGQYWGIHNIREKINENYIAAHHNVNPDEIDMLEFQDLALRGDNLQYKTMYNFISSNNMTNNANYEKVKQMMDVDNFITYMISEIYFDNTDWPGNNLKYWRPRTPDGKFRWILYDTDFGFGLYNTGYNNNTLDFATADNGPEWPNPPWSTLVLRKLLTNTNFKNEFINRFSDFSNTIFKSTNVINRIREMKAVIEPEIKNHLARWSQDYNNWIYQVERLEAFASNRIAYMRSHFIKKFSLSTTVQVKVNISEKGSGKIKLNSLVISDSAWTGFYFKGIPITATAIPNPGYRFVKWKDVAVDSSSFTFTLPGDFNISAVFEPDNTTGRVVINEINYNSSPDSDSEDWVELYNNSDDAINLSDWYFKDEDDLHTFVIKNKILPKGEYLVLCKDTSKFTKFFPEVKNKIGNFNFSLDNNGELIRFFDFTSNLVDSVRYNNKSPWPDEADGNGSTLSLKNPALDNYFAENWSASISNGTPGKQNDVFTGINLSIKSDIPYEFSLAQNYPNPFNPVTKINYSIPSLSLGAKSDDFIHVSLRIYDVLGKQTVILVDEIQPTGNYTVELNASNLSSGIYFYQLKAGDFVSTKKMILLR